MGSRFLKRLCVREFERYFPKFGGFFFSFRRNGKRGGDSPSFFSFSSDISLLNFFPISFFWQRQLGQKKKSTTTHGKRKKKKEKKEKAVIFPSISVQAKNDESTSSFRRRRRYFPKLFLRKEKEKKGRRLLSQAFS